MKISVSRDRLNIYWCMNCLDNCTEGDVLFMKYVRLSDTECKVCKEEIEWVD